MSAWDDEYRRSGIPSSFRDDPSGVVVWAVESWPRLTGDRLPARALDIGCGTARNTTYLGGLGVETLGFDASEVAVAAGRERLAKLPDGRVQLLVHDLHDGLPVAQGSVDLILDVFVYKHQIEPEARRDYRAEMLRALSPGGRVLMSLAEPTDGYYATCPVASSATAGPHAIVDPAVGVGSVLFTLEQLSAEMAGGFEIEMAWRKHKSGVMHGERYMRRTLATIWRRSDA
jgi:SAM-dependent methyltransferase